MSIDKRIEALEQTVPKGYVTFDADGQPAIQSDLPALEWVQAAQKLLRSRGREAEKAELKKQLTHSVGADGDDGYVYQVVAGMAAGPVRKNGGR